MRANHAEIIEDSSSRKPNSIDLLVGARLKLRRRLLGLTQIKLAELIGVTFQQVQKYESGTNRIGAGRLFEVSQMLGVPVQFFYDDITQETPGAVDEASASWPPTAEIMDVVATPDGLKLMRAFLVISDPRRRRALVALAQSMIDQAE